MFGRRKKQPEEGPIERSVLHRVALTYRLASPIIGIRVKNKTTLAGKGAVKNKGKGDKNNGREPHEPRCVAGAFVVRGKCEKDQ
jgi:hypothetical protein